MKYGNKYVGIRLGLYSNFIELFIVTIITIIIPIININRFIVNPVIVMPPIFNVLYFTPYFHLSICKIGPILLLTIHAQSNNEAHGPQIID